MEPPPPRGAPPPPQDQGDQQQQDNPPPPPPEHGEDENDLPEDNSEDDNTDDDEDDGEEDCSTGGARGVHARSRSDRGPRSAAVQRRQGKSGNSGSRSVVLSDSRGRYVKPMLPRGPVRRSPWTPPWGSGAVPKTVEREPPLVIEEGDLRAKKRSARLAPWWCSSWMPAAQWPEPDAERQGCDPLLTEAYETAMKRPLPAIRPKCSCPHPFDHRRTPPAGIDALRVVTAGHGHTQAACVGANALATGDLGQVVVVAITDGRGNVPSAPPWANPNWRGRTSQTSSRRCWMWQLATGCSGSSCW